MHSTARALVRCAFTGLCAAAFAARLFAGPAAGPEWWAEDEPTPDGPFELELELGGGYLPTIGPADSSLVLADLTPGFAVEDLISRVYVHRLLSERLGVHIDYRSERRLPDPFADPNLISVEYLGPESAFITRAALGNEIVAIPGDRYVDTSAVPGSNYAAVVSAGTEVFGGSAKLSALVRVGGSERAEISFVGGRQQTTVELRDTDHRRHRDFFLPDPPDSGSLELFVRTGEPADVVLSGESYRRLSAPDEFTFDAGHRWIRLSTSVRDTELLATYRSANLPVGDPELGRNAYIGTDGLRADFSVLTHSDSFLVEGGSVYLRLHVPGTNSYWEHRGVYRVDGIADAVSVRIETVVTSTRQATSNYAEILESAIVVPDEGLLAFFPEDAAGFYPRPFPGNRAFTDPVAPENPFDPANTVYSALAANPPASVTTLVLTLVQDAEGLRIDEPYAGSVSVLLDGRLLDPSEFSVEPDGEVILAEGLLRPGSRVTVRYLRRGDQTDAPDVRATTSLDWTNDRLSAHTLLDFAAPLDQDIPSLGEERPVSATLTNEVSYTRGDPDTKGVRATVHGAARLENPNAAGSVLIADMAGNSTHSIGLSSVDWQIAAESSLLSTLFVSQTQRGDLLYRDYVEETLLSNRLREIDWSGARTIAYADKAGPYNTADASPDGGSISLVLDYEFGASPGQFASVIRGVDGGLNRFDTLEVSASPDTLSGSNVRLYLEILNEPNEDIDGDGMLDGEASPDEPGFPIVPTGGGATVIGADRFLSPNGILDSEDINDNGRLDPGAGAETGVVVGAGDSYLREFTSTDSWTTVRLDLRPFLSAFPAAFEGATAIRLTLVPVDASVESSGRLLVGRIDFMDSGIATSPDGRLQARTIPSEDPPHSFDDDGRSLRVDFVPPLADGDRTWLAVPFGTPRDLSLYERVGFQLWVEDPVTVPAAVRFDFRLNSTTSDYLETRLAPDDLAPGWNDIAISTAEPYAVTVNGSPHGDAATTGALGSLQATTSVELGITASGAPLDTSFTFVTDSWLLSSSQPRLGFAGGIEVSAGLDDAFDFRGLPVVSGLKVAAGYGYDALDPQTPGRHRADGTAEATIGGHIPVAVTAGLQGDRAFDTDRLVTLDMSAGIIPDRPWLPTIEHNFTYAVSNQLSAPLVGSAYVDATVARTSATIRVSERIDVPDNVAQRLEAARTVVADRSDSLAPDPGTISSGVTMEDLARGSIRLGRAGGWTGMLETAFQRSLNSPAAVGPLSPWDAYGIGVSRLVTGEIVPLASLSSTSHESRASFESPTASSVGIELSASERLTQRFEAEQRRVASFADARIGIPIGSTEGPVRLTPYVGRGVGVTLSAAGAADTQWLVLARSAASALDPRTVGSQAERDLARELSSSFASGLPADTRVTSTAGIESRFRSSVILVPGVIRTSASTATALNAGNPLQTRTYDGAIEKSLPFVRPGQGAGSLVYSVATSFAQDLGLDTETLKSSLSLFWAFTSISGRAWQIRQDSSWERRRQSVGESRLAMFPDNPELEPLVSYRPDLDRLSNRTGVDFMRENTIPVSGRAWLTRRLGIISSDQTVRNSEGIRVETSMAIVDPAFLGTTVQLPLRVTLEHQTELERTDQIAFGLRVKGVFGIEQHVEAGTVNTVPAFGLEARATMRIRY